MADKAALVEPYASYFSRPVVEVVRDLEHYESLLRNWQSVQNLVSRETLNEVWTRHFVDSLQLIRLVKSTDNTFLDLGSGGGFPAIPMAIAQKSQDVSFTLIEPTSRKASFLRTVTRELGLPVTVENKRSDAVSAADFRIDVITSRALAPLDELCAMAFPFFGKTTRALFHKGREHADEFALASGRWDFDVLLTTSDTDASAVIVELTQLSPKARR